MLILVFLLILAAVAGVLGAIVKAVALIVLAGVAVVTLLAWIGWRSIRRTLDAPMEGRPLDGTTITIGRARRDPPDAGPLGEGRDDRY